MVARDRNFPMTCAEFERFLHPYLDGEFEADEQLEFERHLAGCEARSRTVHAETGFRDALRRTSKLAASVAPARLREKIQTGLRREHRRAVVTSWVQVSAAALVMVSVGGAYYFLRPSPRG